MRSSYGIPLRSRAFRSIRALTATTLLAYALFALFNLMTTPSASAAPEAAAEAAAATGTPEAVGGSLPASLEPGSALVTVLVLGAAVALVVVARRLLAPIARGEFPFGPANPGM